MSAEAETAIREHICISSSLFSVNADKICAVRECGKTGKHCERKKVLTSEFMCAINISS
jgi:hypothetical protein